jgi:hypothetical protein
LFSWRKRKLKVDLVDLTDEGQSLAGFLRYTLKVGVAFDGKSVSVDSEELSPEDLKKSVNRFIYHQHLNNKYWVALDGRVVKIGRFKESKRSGKRNRQAIQPSTIKHGW